MGVNRLYFFSPPRSSQWIIAVGLVRLVIYSLLRRVAAERRDDGPGEGR